MKRESIVKTEEAIIFLLPPSVYGRVPAVPGGRGPQGRERCHSGHQDQQVHPVRRLVSHRVQGMATVFSSFSLLESSFEMREHSE